MEEVRAIAEDVALYLKSAMPKLSFLVADFSGQADFVDLTVSEISGMPSTSICKIMFISTGVSLRSGFVEYGTPELYERIADEVRNMLALSMVVKLYKGGKITRDQLKG